MPASAAQTQFAAEFVLFLVALAGLALVALRAALLTESRWGRAMLAVGFAGLTASAFLHGSLLVPNLSSPVIVGLRAAGIACVAAGAARWRATGWARSVLWAGLVLLAAALSASLVTTGGAVAALQAAGALGLGASLLAASRRSVAARIAASAAATLLLVVLVLSVALSAVVASTVRDEFLVRLDTRALAEATALENTSVDAIEKARLTAAALATRPEELLEVASSNKPSVTLDAALERISDSFVSNLSLAYITENRRVVSTSKLPPTTFAPIAAGAAVNRALATATEQSSIDVVGRQALAIGVAAVVARNPGGGTRVIGVTVAAAILDDNYLRRRAADDPALSLALYAEGGTRVAGFGRLPADADVSAVARRVLATGRAARAVAGERFLVGRVVEGPDDRPVMALVASTPTTLVDQTRDSLFRTLFLIALGGAFLALLLASVVGDRISSGLRRLTTAAEAIQRGQLGVRAGIASEDEVGVLGSAFDSMVASIEDKTAAIRRAADDEARLRNRLEAIVAGMGEALVAVDADGRITDFNQAAEELLDVEAVDVRGRTLGDVVAVRADDGADLRDRFSRLPSRRWSMRGTVDVAGDRVPVTVSAGPLRGPSGELVGAVVVLRDLRRELEVERMKTEFLSRVGHELRTPVTKILAAAQLLASREVPADRAREFHRAIYESGKELSRIVEMLEFFAAVAAGREILQPEAVDPRELLRDVVSRRSENANGHTIRQRVASGVPAVLADRRWLTLSIDELVDNAVKFSPAGGSISLSANVVNGERGAGVEISVSDNGIGMAPEEVGRVFSEWAQGDESDTRQFGGLGLGLALVKRVAEGHGGEVTCVTAPGKGSRFSILLPAVKGSSTPHPVPPRGRARRDAAATGERISVVPRRGRRES